MSIPKLQKKLEKCSLVIEITKLNRPYDDQKKLSDYLIIRSWIDLSINMLKRPFASTGGG